MGGRKGYFNPRTYTPLNDSFCKMIMQNNPSYKNKSGEKRPSESFEMKEDKAEQIEQVNQAKQVKQTEQVKIVANSFEETTPMVQETKKTVKKWKIENKNYDEVIEFFRDTDIAKIDNDLYNSAFNDLDVLNSLADTMLGKYIQNNHVIGLIIEKKRAENLEIYRRYIRIDRPLIEVLLEIYHYAFPPSQLAWYFNIMENRLDKMVKPPLTKATELYLLALAVPKKYEDYSKIVQFIEYDLIKYIKRYKTDESLSTALNIGLTRAFKLHTLFSRFEDEGIVVTNFGLADADLKYELNNNGKNIVDYEPNMQKKAKKIKKDISLIEANKSKKLNDVISEYVELLKMEEMEINVSEYSPISKFETYSNFLDYTQYDAYDISDIELFDYAFMCINNTYLYSSTFYPAEDKILELYYKELGNRVVEVMEAVIPDYKPKSDIDYMLRVRKLGCKCPHPINSFGYLKEYDERIISLIAKKYKRGFSKYIPWLDIFDLQYYANQMGFSVSLTKKEKQIVNLSKIDISKYIESASKLREVVYHETFWTSDKHDIFKKYFKDIGPNVGAMIEGSTFKICQDHSLKYKIYQNYTDKEVEEMKKVYFSNGFEGLVKAFPYRTREALKYKVEEEKWGSSELDVGNFLKEKVDFEVNSRIKSMMEDYKNEYTEKIREEEAQKIRKKVRSEESQKIEAEVTGRLRKTIEKNVTLKLSKEIGNQLKEDESKKLNSLKKQVGNIDLSDDIGRAITAVLAGCKLSDITTKLPDALQKSILDSLQSKMSDIIKSVF